MRAFAPQLQKMGVTLEGQIERRGFYPAGGGRVVFDVTPSDKLIPLEVSNAGDIRCVKAPAVQTKLRKGIIIRELRIACERLGVSDEQCVAVYDTQADGPGNSFWIEVVRDQLSEVFTCHGERGVSAEAVAKSACKEAERYINRPGAAVGPYLAAQLLRPMALAGRGRITTLRPSLHTITNIETIKEFIDIDIRVDEVDEGVWAVEIGCQHPTY